MRWRGRPWLCSSPAAFHCEVLPSVREPNPPVPTGATDSSDFLCESHLWNPPPCVCFFADGLCPLTYLKLKPNVKPGTPDGTFPESSRFISIQYRPLKNVKREAKLEMWSDKLSFFSIQVEQQDFFFTTTSSARSRFPSGAMGDSGDIRCLFLFSSSYMCFYDW